MKAQTNQLQLTSDADVGNEEDISFSLGRHILRPNLNSAATISSFQTQVPHSDLPAMLDELDAQTSAVWAQDLGRPEEMLSAQAHTLDAIFNTLAQKASKAMISGHLPSTEAYLRMALKAQSQCRTTLEALAEIKAPRAVAFIRQANIAQQQQVNNGHTVNGATPARAHEKEINTSSNKLISGENHATLDTRGTGAAIRIDPQVEAVGAVHRPKNRSRKSRGG